mgnify:CR=1 FL=1
MIEMYALLRFNKINVTCLGPSYDRDVRFIEV